MSGCLSVDELERLYRQGASLRELSERDGRSTTWIHKALRARGVPMRAKSGHRRFDMETRAAILAAYREGLPMARICERFGVSGSTVRGIVLEAGGELRPRGGQVRIDWGVVERLAGEGWSPAAIAMLVGASEGGVRHILRTLAEERYGKA